ncbi:MAG: deoxycytidylate deaminase [Alphaproteobacteria bacterium]
MGVSEYDLMQQAVDIVGTSEHPTNKVAAALAGNDAGRPFAIARTNYWPPSIAEKIGREMKIGNSSGTVHAETACLLDAPATEGATLFVTDVPCPNCVKNMAEAGVRAMYIDHKGFTKDFALRRGGHFDNMSLRICEKAGIAVYKIFRKEKRIEPILKIPEGFNPVIEKPARIAKLAKKPGREEFLTLAKTEKENYGSRPFAFAAATSAAGDTFTVSAETHPCPGYTAQTVEKGDEKYSTILQPVNRVMMTATRHGLRIEPGFLYSSRVPTARELVDMAGAGLTRLAMGDRAKSRDSGSIEALEQLLNAQIMTIWV